MTAKPAQPEGLTGAIQSEVAAEASPLMRFLIAHARFIVIGIILFIVAIAGYSLYAWRADSSLQAEARELGQYLVISDPAMRLAQLEAYAPNAPASVQRPLQFAIMEAATATGDADKAYAAWKAISGYGPAMKVVAAKGMAAILADQGKYKEALALLSGIAGDLSGGNLISVNTRIVLLAEVVGDYHRALAACEAILSDPQAVSESVIWAQKKGELEAKLAAAPEKDAAPVKATGAGSPAANATDAAPAAVTN